MMVPLELLYAFLAGSKWYFIPLLAAPIISYNYLRKRVRLAHFCVPWLIMIFVVFPVNDVYREVV
ncbi:hypothetical protein MYX64_13565, partial [Nitrospinae bacterium AH_259_B05_G02_I21]|nr:hypothetical protein [Nitrospinae bacterium AH_259_B05_G02_I21]